MADQLTHQELLTRSAEVLRDVAAGATYEITDQGRVVAVLSPPSVGSLRIRQPTVQGRFAELVRACRDAPAQSVLDDQRSDR